MLRFLCIACLACAAVSYRRSDSAALAASLDKEVANEEEMTHGEGSLGSNELCDCHAFCRTLTSVSVAEARKWNSSNLPQTFFKYWMQDSMKSEQPSRLYAGLYEERLYADWASKYQDCGIALGSGSGHVQTLKVKKKATEEYVAVKYQEETESSKNEVAMLNKFKMPDASDAEPKKKNHIIQIQDAVRMDWIWKTRRGNEPHPYSVFATEMSDGNLNMCMQSNPQDKLLLFKSMLQGLQIVHDAGVAHRNLKPSNVLVFGDCAEAKVSDFKLACAVHMQKLSCRNVAGDPKYQAPELLKATLPAASRTNDMWAAGIILYELVHDHYPAELLASMDPCIGKMFENECKVRQLKKNIIGVREFVQPGVAFNWMQGESVPVIDLIEALLQPIPKDRLNVQKALDAVNEMISSH